MLERYSRVKSFVVFHLVYDESMVSTIRLNLRVLLDGCGNSFSSKSRWMRPALEVTSTARAPLFFGFADAPIRTPTSPWPSLHAFIRTFLSFHESFSLAFSHAENRQRRARARSHRNATRRRRNS